MKQLLILIAFCSTVSVCFGQRQAQMNEEAMSAYQKADKELNSVYKRILADYKEDTAFIHNLRTAQRIWIEFRDAEMKMKYPDRQKGHYGSVKPMCWYNYLAILTNKRIEDLKVWLNGTEEGDVCAGSVKFSE